MDSEGAERIAAERRRQVEEEGYSAEHDDEHDSGQLASAAVCYATPRRLYEKEDHATGTSFDDPWPWEDRSDARWGKGEDARNPGNVPPDPKTYTAAERVDLLVKAGALVAAEIDRLLRADAAGETAVWRKKKRERA